MIPVFFLLNVVLAWIDATRINKGKFIDHYYNGFIYACFVGLAYYIRPDLNLVVGLLLYRIPIFNTFLNIFRGLNSSYISDNPASLVDRILNPCIRILGYWTFNTVILLLALYFIIIDLI